MSFYYVSKLFWFFAQPSSVMLSGLLVGLYFFYKARVALAFRILTGFTLLLLITGLSPLGHLMLLPLEQAYPVRSLQSVAKGRKIDGIIVLGGAIDTIVSRARGVAGINEAGERLTMAAALARRFPGAKLLFTGAGSGIFYADVAETVLARSVFARLGIDEKRLILESRARNTFQNAVYSKQLADAKAGERWLLVTSAYHMARSMGCFRKIGFNVEAFPVDFRTRGPADLWRFFGKPSEGWRRVDLASREWIGLLAYRLTGRTTSLFPVPYTNERNY